MVLKSLCARGTFLGPGVPGFGTGLRRGRRKSPNFGAARDLTFWLGMSHRNRAARVVLAVSLVVLGSLGIAAAHGRRIPLFGPFDNSSGEARTVSTGRPHDRDSLFFEELGTNGRTCVTCHMPGDGWTVVPAHVQARFERSHGHDPIFRTNDGSNSPLADVSTVDARRAAYSLLLRRAVIRVGLPIPAGAEFTLEAVDDPYGYASAAELSLFRRPLPSTNLKLLSTLMWDGRETFPGQPMALNLAHQANGATVGHAQALRDLSPAERDDIVAFESHLFTAQVRDGEAGELHAAGARGGPRALAEQVFYPGINSSADPSGRPFDPRVFTLFDRWASAPGRLAAARRSVARGEAIFNERRFGIRASTCSGCHNAPNAGSNSNGLFSNLGLSDASRRTPDMPLYTLRCTSTGALFKTTDPGRALVTGRCADINRFKLPTLRGLAARAPYFHNGLAATLEAVVQIYEERFGMGLTAEETRDLVAFLRAL
jgi:cytochrome c peroxidase